MNSGYYDSNDPDRAAWMEPLWLPHQASLPRWGHRCLVAIWLGIFAYASFTAGLLRSPEPRQFDYTSAQGWDLVRPIVQRAVNDSAYSSAQCAQDVAQIDDIVQRTAWSGDNPIECRQVGVIRFHAAEVLLQQTMIPRWKQTNPSRKLWPDEEDFLRHRARQEIVVASEQALRRTGKPIDWSQVGLTLAGLWLIGLPFGLVVLLQRVMVASRDLKEVWALVRFERHGLIAATMLWPLGVIYYRPEVSVLFDAITALARRRGSLVVGYQPYRQSEPPSCPIWQAAATEVLTWRFPRLVLLRTVWWTPSPNRDLPRKIGWQIGQLPYRLYATAALAIILALNGGQAADYSIFVRDKGGDKKPTSYNLRVGSSQPGRWQTWWYGMPPNTTLEVSYSVGKIKEGLSSTTWGMYVREDLAKRRLTQYGLTGALDLSVLDGKVNGAWYADLKRGGLYAPNLRWTKEVTPGVRLGIGAGVQASYRLHPDLMVGPYAQFKLGHDGLFRMRAATDPRRPGRELEWSGEFLAFL